MQDATEHLQTAMQVESAVKEGVRISSNDCVILGRHRRLHTKWMELPTEDRGRLVGAHRALLAAGNFAADQLDDSTSFELVPTSGFSTKSGVRGYLPKDLWISFVNVGSAPFLGMPQIYAIFSERGIEIGFAPAVSPNDFSNASFKEKLRKLAPQLFAALPDSSADEFAGIREAVNSGSLLLRDRTRAGTLTSEFSSLQAWLDDLNSPAGHRRASGAIALYFAPKLLDDPTFDLNREFAAAVKLFSPMMKYVGTRLGFYDEQRPLKNQVETLRPQLEQLLVTYGQVSRSQPFGINEELWDLFEGVVSAFRQSAPLVERVHIAVEWGAGQGNWAQVPWISFTDDRETSNRHSGVYIVLLLRGDLSGMYWALIQGIEQIRHEMGEQASEEWLRSNADKLRQQCDELEQAGFSLRNDMDVRATSSRAKAYEASVVAHRFYARDQVPSDDEIVDDLERMLEVYEMYVLEKTDLGPDIDPTPTKSDHDANHLNVWLVAPGRNADHWDEFYRDGLIGIGWDELGDLRQYASQDAIFNKLVELSEQEDSNPTNNALALYNFVAAMQPGDLVFAKKGMSTIVGYGTIIGEYTFDPTRQLLKHTRKVRWDGRGEWKYQGILAQKTLTEIGKWPKAVADLKKLVGQIDADDTTATPISERSPFSIEEALDGLFVPEVQFREMLGVWRARKNVILQGPPGVGKTFVARRLAYALMGFRDPSRLAMLQFHQSYSYEDFIQGYRPSAEGFALRNGLFLEFCRRAVRDQDNAYVFVIDEINRGNLGKIFGELLMLIEYDKRSSEWAVPLTYSPSVEDQFYVPPNVFLLGMMNTADRSLAVVDYALRRRFAFMDLAPAFGSESFRAHHLKYKVPTALTEKIIARMTELNLAIAEDRPNLGRGFQIGHSFFTPSSDGGPYDEEWYRRVVTTEVVPLIREYWFEDEATAEKWATALQT